MATRSKPACIGRSEGGGLSLGGVDGLGEADASTSEFVFVVDCKFEVGEDILGGRSSLASPSSALLGESVFGLTKVAVEGGRDTFFCGVVLVFFRENHPDFFFWLSSSRTTTRSSVKSGSYKVDKHAG